MQNPFTNFNNEIKNNFQGAINHLGPDFYNHKSLADGLQKEVLAWQSFGHESSSWYHVSVMQQIGDTHQWACVGCAVISTDDLNWDAVHPKKEVVTA